MVCAKRAATGAHEFDRLCADLSIEHRLTRPMHPQTNGMVERFNGRIEDVLQSHHFRSGEALEATLHRYVWLYNQQLPQSALGSRSPLQAMKDWYKLKPELFRKRPYYLPGCDTYQNNGESCSVQRNAKTAVITGILGQDGSYLYQSLLADNYKVLGTSRKKSAEIKGLDMSGLPPVNIVTLQIANPVEVYNLMKTTRPDELYLLAAHSSVGDSWKYSVETMNTNYLSTRYFLEAIRKLGLETRVFIASSSDMYGNSPPKQKDESGPFDPISPYGISKLAAHNLAELYRAAYGIFVCSGIMFNHESPIRGAEFVTSKICNGLNEFKFAGGPSVKLGNINAKRDFGYAPDFVAGMRKMMQLEKPDDFVLATGQSKSIRNFIECAAANLDLDLKWHGTGLQEYAVDTASGRKAIEISKEFFREIDIKETNGNYSKAHAQLGWAPTLTFEEMVRKLVATRGGR